MAQKLQVLCTTEVGVGCARASLVMVARPSHKTRQILKCAAAELGLAITSQQIVDIRIVRKLSLQDDQRGSTMARELRKGHQVVSDLLHIHIPFAYLSKTLCFNVEEEILRLDQIVCFICVCLKEMIKSQQNTVLYHIIVAILNKEDPSSV